jgi:hypothetical protein
LIVGVSALAPAGRRDSGRVDLRQPADEVCQAPRVQEDVLVEQPVRPVVEPVHQVVLQREGVRRLRRRTETDLLADIQRRDSEPASGVRQQFDPRRLLTAVPVEQQHGRPGRLGGTQHLRVDPVAAGPGEVQVLCGRRRQREIDGVDELRLGRQRVEIE